ncbi:MAG: DegV domain-containing protein [Bacteroidetes bacterium ADurb.Bin416]|nr:MAG: DegV domain-containing protein [Bacteroidetes bacterium ADurb.Bin416]
MKSICIIADSTAQFPQPAFLGRSSIRFLPLDIRAGGVNLGEDGDIKVSSFPARASHGFLPQLHLHQPELLHQYVIDLEKAYDEILFLVHSSALSPVYDELKRALVPFGGHTNISLIDTQTIGPGLGMLAQLCSELAAKGLPLVEIERLLRVQIPHIYAVFCTPNHSYLHNSGFLDAAQSKVSEMLNLFGVFTLEEGRLNPVEKVKNHRSVTEIFQEFMEEFENIRSISIVQSNPPASAEVRALRQYAEETFGKTPISEHPISPHVAAIMGPRTLGMFVVEFVKLA